uniref:Uncharacterized protein n=1 Tax=Solanum lycopersicum TaxID=4081 RepID=A0A3Q7GUP8_SOLLC
MNQSSTIFRIFTRQLYHTVLINVQRPENYFSSYARPRQLKDYMLVSISLDLREPDFPHREQNYLQ